MTAGGLKGGTSYGNWLMPTNKLNAGTITTRMMVRLYDNRMRRGRDFERSEESHLAIMDDSSLRSE